MLSRHHAYRIGCALLGFAGLCWLTRADHTPVPAVPSRLAPAQCPKQPAKRASVVFAGDPSEPKYQTIHELLDEQGKLGPADREREDEIRLIFRSRLTDRNASEIVQSFSTEELNSEFGLTALARWAANDAITASLWLARQPAQSAEQTWTIAQVITKDPVVLEVLCERLPAGIWREALLADCSRAALAENSAIAIAIAQRLLPGNARTRALLTIADEWTLRDPAATAHWIASEADLQVRDELISAASAAQASTDPLGALAGVSGISSDDIFDRSLSKITTMWANYEPMQAKHFVTLLEPRPISPAP